MRATLRKLGVASATLGAGVGIAGPASSAPLVNPVAVFSGLDKITGRTIQFDVMMEETVQFGALQVTPHACHTRPPTEPAQTTAFVDVDEVTLADKVERIFTGWMFAASPGLHAVEHPVYDVWLVNCKTSMNEEPTAPSSADVAPKPDEGLVLPPDEGAPED